MLILQEFSAENLPMHFVWQIRDFARMEWHNDITHNINTALHPAHWNPIYFVLSEDQMLISAAAVLWKTIKFEEQTYKVYGLGMVLTYPVHRKQGYGRQIVSASTSYICEQEDADFAILQTAPHLEQFYAEHGWVHMPTMTILSGPVDDPIDDDGWIMALFLSEKARANQRLFEKNAFYLDQHIW